MSEIETPIVYRCESCRRELVPTQEDVQPSLFSSARRARLYCLACAARLAEQEENTHV